MRMRIFGVFANLLAALVLFGVGAHHLNNLDTSIPATLCLIAGIGNAVKLAEERKASA